jgi:hypothetical protein
MQEQKHQIAHQYTNHLDDSESQHYIIRVRLGDGARKTCEPTMQEQKHQIAHQYTNHLDDSESQHYTNR